MKEGTLFIDKVLEYIDEPQLLIARDDFGTMYLCLLYDNNKYTGIRISLSKLAEYENGQVDLLSLFKSPEYTNEYFDVVIQDDKLKFAQIDVVEDYRLPEEGFFNEIEPYENITVKIPVQDKSLFSSIMRKFGWIAM